MGIWSALPEAAYPITEIAVAGQRAKTRRRQKDMSWPLRWQHDTPPMAYVVSNQALKTACEGLIKTSLPAHQIKAVKIDQLQPGQPNLLQDSQQNLWPCDLVIGCDGANSQLRAQAGLRAIDQSRRETALVTTVSTERPIGTTAYQRFSAVWPAGADADRGKICICCLVSSRG